MQCICRLILTGVTIVHHFPGSIDRSLVIVHKENFLKVLARFDD